MANEDTARGREIIAQLSPGDMLGNQKAEIRSMPLDSDLVLGTVLGEVRGLSYRHNPQDDSKPSIALVGPFKFIPAKPDRPELWASRAFLPGAIHDGIVNALQGDNKAPVTKSPGRKDKAIDVMLGAVMPIVLEVGVRSKPESSVGYVYIAQSSAKVPLELNDPLAALSARAGIKSVGTGPARMAIAGPTGSSPVAGSEKKSRGKK